MQTHLVHTNHLDAGHGTAQRRLPQSDRLHHGQTLPVKCEHCKDQELSRSWYWMWPWTCSDDLQIQPPKGEKPGQHKDQAQSGETQGPQHCRNFSSKDRRKVCSTPHPEIDALINSFNTAVTETANNILGKHRPAKKPWVAENILKLCNKLGELKQKKNTTEGATLYREANQQVKKVWEEQRRHGLKNNAKVGKKTCRKTTARKPTSLWKNWQAQNKGELLPSRTKHGHVSQTNKKSWRSRQSTVLNCIHTQQQEIPWS